MKKLLLTSRHYFLLFICIIQLAVIKPAVAQTSDPTITKLFKDAYHVWELMRNNKGMYRDSKLLNNNNDYHPASVANVGVGLVTLCIADAMGWDINAADKAIVTLNSVNGHTPGFTPDRTTNGYFRHFINMETGAQEWNSEYSTIDTDLLMIGAIFCKNYFHDNATIADLVDELWNSIDFTAAINDPAIGKIYLKMNADGTGGTTYTLPYNEYMLVAWLAKHDTKNNTTQAQLFWDNWYGNVNNLPKSTFSDNDVLTDDKGGKRFISSFTHQFNYYYISYFASSEVYMQYYVNSKDAEKAYWQTSSGANYEWGCGAGIDVDGYKANKINNNPYWTVSPHIIAGYLPIESTAKADLVSIYTNNKGVYDLPDDATRKILWRYSLTDTDWKGNAVQGIDFSTFLYGLATLPEYLGADFFSTYNQLDGGSVDMPVVDDDKQEKAAVGVYPNPAMDGWFLIDIHGISDALINVYSVSGVLIESMQLEGRNAITISTEHYDKGIYIIRVSGGNQVVSERVVIQ